MKGDSHTRNMFFRFIERNALCGSLLRAWTVLFIQSIISHCWAKAFVLRKTQLWKAAHKVNRCSREGCGHSLDAEGRLIWCPFSIHVQRSPKMCDFLRTRPRRSISGPIGDGAAGCDVPVKLRVLRGVARSCAELPELRGPRSTGDVCCSVALELFLCFCAEVKVQLIVLGSWYNRL